MCVCERERERDRQTDKWGWGRGGRGAGVGREVCGVAKRDRELISQVNLFVSGARRASRSHKHRFTVFARSPEIDGLGSAGPVNSESGCSVQPFCSCFLILFKGPLSVSVCVSPSLSVCLAVCTLQSIDTIT